MSTPAARLSQAQTQWLDTQLKSAFKETFVSQRVLAGDGSSRLFLRVATQSRSAILVLDPRWDQTRDYTAHRDFLARHNIPVPNFFGQSPELGILLMEDLGDQLLQSLVVESPNTQETELGRLSEILANLHGKTYPVPPEIPASQRVFDKTKLMEECLFAGTHLVQNFLGLSAWGPKSLSALEAFCTHMAELTPKCFAHRDFHTRNVMVTNGRLTLIDFQDARLGPPHYDLASLLFDPYVPLTDLARAAIRSCYSERLKEFELGRLVSWGTFEEDLQTCAFQRLIKAAGSFASFFTRYQKKTHLPYLIPAIQSALAIPSTQALASVLGLENWLERIEKAKLIS